MQAFCRSVLHFLAVLLLWTFSRAAIAEDYQHKGYIQNDRGTKCWYSQTTNPTAKYFHDLATSTTGHIVFDDPSCMSASEFGQRANQMMINNMVTRWYSHSDADFDTKNLHNSSPGQTRGKCIQSRTYELIAVAIEYIEKDDSIVEVYHAPTLTCDK